MTNQSTVKLVVPKSLFPYRWTCWCGNHPASDYWGFEACDGEGNLLPEEMVPKGDYAHRYYRCVNCGRVFFIHVIAFLEHHGIQKERSVIEQ